MPKTIYERTRRSVVLNDVEDCSTVKHAIVAEEIRIEEDPDGTSVVPVSDLPDCDMMLIDCDGCEMQILSDSVLSVGGIIVEHHAVKDRIRVFEQYRQYRDVTERTWTYCDRFTDGTYR